MHSSSSRRAALTRPRVSTRTARGLNVTTREEDGYELTVRPTSSSSSGGNSSKNSGSSRGSSFRNPFRRRHSKRKQQSEKETRNQHSQATIPNHPQEKAQTEQISPPVELRLRLLPRIAEYKERRWINDVEEGEFVQLLQDHPVDFDQPTDHAAIRVKKALDLIKERQEQRESQRSRDRRSYVTKPRPSEPQQEQHTRVVFAPKENMETTALPPSPSKMSNKDYSTTKPRVSKQGIKRVLSPAELWESKEVQETSKVEELFVEMCFFARLGFIQPPSCLRCVYHESMNDRSPDMTCQRWVAWRKNASTQLHPHRLEDNIMMVQCCAVRSLLSGKTVDNCEWDSESKILTRHNKDC